MKAETDHLCAETIREQLMRLKGGGNLEISKANFPHGVQQKQNTATKHHSAQEFSSNLRRRSSCSQCNQDPGRKASQSLDEAYIPELQGVSHLYCVDFQKKLFLWVGYLTNVEGCFSCTFHCATYAGQV